MRSQIRQLSRMGDAVCCRICEGAQVTRRCGMGIEGKWFNEIGSLMTIEPIGGNVFTGEYQTRVGDAGGIYSVSGQTDGDQQSLGWTVGWVNNDKGDSHSVTSWSGAVPNRRRRRDHHRHVAPHQRHHHPRRLEIHPHRQRRLHPHATHRRHRRPRQPRTHLPPDLAVLPLRMLGLAAGSEARRRRSSSAYTADRSAGVRSPFRPTRTSSNPNHSAISRSSSASAPDTRPASCPSSR